jgi:YbbR domain-containing protein
MYKQFQWLDSVKEYARDYILENTGLKVLALLITAVLWLSVASRPVSEVTMYNVPIEFKNIPESPQLAVSKYDAPSLTARIYLRGPRDVIDTLRLSELSAFADLTGVEPGVRLVTLQVDTARLPASLVARVLEPHSIRVTVERVVERELQIKPRFDGEPPPGYKIAGFNVTPANVRIIGAASHVREINEVSTETVGLSDRTETFSREVTVDIGNPNVNVKDESSRKVMLTVNITEVTKERVFDRVPIPVEGLDSATVNPSFLRVVVQGPASAVDAILPSDIIVSVAGLSATKSGDVTPFVTLSPAYVDLVSVRLVQPKTVRIR